MKICTVSQSFYPYVGGVTRYLLALGRRLIDRGDELVVVHLKAGDAPDFEVVDGIKVYRMSDQENVLESIEGYFKFKELIIDITHGNEKVNYVPVEDRFNQGYPEYLGFNVSMYEKVKQVYETEQFDILHVHDFQVMPLAFLLRGELNVPTVFTWHIPFTDVMPAEWRDFLIRYMQYYDRIIFSTDEYVRTAVESGLDPEKISKINPFIETEKYCRSEENGFREKFDIQKDHNIVLCVARIDPRKGQEYLIRAMKEVVRKEPKTTCVFIGNGSLTKKILGRKNMLEELEALVDELGIGEHIKFLGKVSNEDLLEAYEACDMLVLPSINEGFGLVLSEAMCFSKPLIGSNIGGIPEQIMDGFNGHLFKPRDHRELAERIISLIENPELRREMGENGRKLANTRFCVERGFLEHCDIYDTIHLQKRIRDRSGAGESLLTE
ncbi:glycosyltransferase family 1 protein [Methanocella sp. CWC-04]|uniref:Glycosyltransferase family 1 protein n=1 Tax=Methanooceanicella nereidis TaxID=2052831 RepID=A0AAP2RBR9_9EURY|nr:glycosyltransferase family 4 protein [Methanocella sp. CWC-04]MCD1294428.1 glycosyltransferase family 1 protein [Methanocella sp. CWC-04]